MKTLRRTVMCLGVAVLSAAMLGVATADDKPAGEPQGSWNDYPVKNVGNFDIPNVTPSPDGNPGYPDVPDEGTPPTPDVPEPPWPIPPTEIIPPAQIPPGTIPPGWIPPRRQQQQGKPGKPGGGGFAWGGKQGGSWGKTKPPQRPPQSQQGAYPGGGQARPNQAQLIKYIQMLQAQNAQLRMLLEQLAGMQPGSGAERSPGLPNGGVPLQ